MDVIRQTERLRDATAMGAEICAQSSAVPLFARTAASGAALIALFVLSAAAHAQSCSPAEPRSDSGAGFAPFGEREQALGRGGHKGRAWEWALGTDTRTRQKVQASLDWVSGRVYSWKLVNSGGGREVLEIREAGNLRLSLTYPSGMDAGNALELRVRTHPSIGEKTSIEASLTSLNGYGVSGSLSQPGTRARSEQALYYYFPQMAQGFTAEGTVSLTYPKKPRGGSRVQFTVRAGTVPCSSAGSAPTVAITDPAAGGVFSAPASVTVTADAQDSDGTVAQVAFFANGNPIGMATSSPFTVQWPNVQAGAYSLTAVATDNEGLQTMSAAVPITVGAGKALYFIHVDHLNTPRLIADAAQKTVWRWDQAEPFGNNPASEDPDGDSVTFSFPLRFPGQYYDAETLLHYNYFRDYDSSLGRYVESDPVALIGGINTFAYVTARPLRFADRFGLQQICDVTCRVAFQAAGIRTPLTRPDGHPWGYGCGSGKGDAFIPDADFFQSCREHDLCYEACPADKTNCDVRFLDGMLRTCYVRVFISVGFGSSCVLKASAYFLAVSSLGGNAFDKAQSSCPQNICTPGGTK